GLTPCHTFPSTVRTRGSQHITGMSDPKRDRDSDRDSLTDWTLVDREGTPEDISNDGAQQEEDEDGAESTITPEGATAQGEDEEEEDDVEESEGGSEEEALSDDLVSLGQKVQEIKASSGSDSSDIETLECPDPGEFYEDHALACNSMNSSLFSSSSLHSFTFVGGSEEGDVESLAGTDISVLDAEKEKLADEETDLSLASSPSLPDDLPAIKPDTQYKHTPDKDLNSRLNIVVALTLACVLGLGLGHFLGWSSRSVWHESMSSAQVRRLRELQDDLVSCMNTPIQASSHPSPEFSVDSPIKDHYQAELNSDNPDYQSDTYIPVLTDGNGDGLLDVESFVESLVMPLEDAGVVLNPSRRQGGMSFLHSKPEGPKLTDPTFATPELIHSKPKFISNLQTGSVKELPEILNEIPKPSVMADTEILLPVVDAEFPPAPLPVSSDNTEAFSEVQETDSVPHSILSRDANVFCGSSSTVGLQQLDQSLMSGCASSLVLDDALSSRVEEDMSSGLPSSVGLEALQVLDEINLENENLESEIIRLQRENIAPIKIRGKDGKYARNLREKINRLIIDNEELRAAVGKLQYADLPDGDATAFTSALEKNYNLRLAVGKLTHLGPDLSALRVSSNDLQTENEELKIKVGKLRYQQQPLPQELNAVARDVEKLRKTIEEASQKKKVPPNLNNAKTYVSYMSQILSAIHTLHEFGEGSLVEKVDVATDIFEDLAPGSIKLNSQLRQKLNVARARFSQIQASLSRKWEKLKELSQPDKMAAVGRDTLARMNRVIVNVVNKVKEIGRSNILRRGKTSIEKTLSTFTDQLTALGLQFDKTWKDLEGEVVVKSDEAADLTADDDNKDDKNKNKDAKNKNKDAKNKNKDAQNKNKDAKNKNKDAKNKNKDTKNKNKDAKNKIKYTGTEDVVEIVPKKREVPESEVKKELLVDKEDEEVGNGKVKKEPHKEAVPKEEEVVSVKARQKPVVKVGAKKDFQAEDVASEQSSEAETKSHKGREGKRRGGGEDKKKIPDDKRKNVAKKIKEKVEEKKQESKRHRSRRNRISQKEEKKDKKEGESQKEESNKKQNDKKNKKSEEKHDSHGNHNDKSRNYHQRNERDRNIKEKDENQRYYKGHYNKYDKKH
ncbi:hypothetical protein OTU49_009447, partial [Cherax quadricarinatus]